VSSPPSGANRREAKVCVCLEKLKEFDQPLAHWLRIWLVAHGSIVLGFQLANKKENSFALTGLELFFDSLTQGGTAFALGLSLGLSALSV